MSMSLTHEQVQRLADTNYLTPLVLYHADCADGFGAAYSLWLKHRNWKFQAQTYGATALDQLLQQVDQHQVVYIVDFSYEPEAMAAICERARHVVWIDHHKGARTKLRPVLSRYRSKLTVRYAQQYSGSDLTWKFVHLSEPLPPLLNHVGLYDTWKFDAEDVYNDTLAACALLGSYGFDFVQWHDLMQMSKSEQHWPQYLNQGRSIVRAHRQLALAIIREQRQTWIMGQHVMPVFNAPRFLTGYINQLIFNLPEFDQYQIIAVYYDTRDSRKWSLRVRSSSRLDADRLARQWGGGGHAKAAGFRTAWGQMPAGAKRDDQ